MRVEINRLALVLITLLGLRDDLLSSLLTKSDQFSVHTAYSQTRSLPANPEANEKTKTLLLTARVDPPGLEPGTIRL